MLAKFILWFLYYPLVRFVAFFVFWIPELVQRRNFEKKNHKEDLCQSFLKQNKRAHHCFEFSSEGEYQQVAPLIQDALTEGKLLELVFFSPSVEKAIVELAQKHPGQIRYLRYPLITFGFRNAFSRWVSSEELILVRYDLFPEFLLWSYLPGKKLKMLWMSFKKERVKGRGISLLKRGFLNRASHVVYASVPDQTIGLEQGWEGTLYDFRIEQIRRRLKIREEKLHNSFLPYGEILKKMQSYPREKRLLIGNAWPSDLQIMDELPEDFFVMVVPHKLESDILRDFKEGLMDRDRAPQEVSDSTEAVTASTLVVNKKGVLCELYADFGKAYVGGGFEGSIHSVLEPLVAGVSQLSCGPAHHRSTEYDLARSFGDICELRNADDFKAWLLSAPDSSTERPSLDEVICQYEERKREVLSC